MILQPKSSNLPENTEQNPKEAIVSAGLNMIPGSENAAVTVSTSTKQPFGTGAEGGDKKKEDVAQVAATTTTPRQQKKTTTTPMKEDKPVLGQ